MNSNIHTDKARAAYLYALNNNENQEKLDRLLSQYCNLLSYKKKTSDSVNTPHSPQSGYSCNTPGIWGGSI
jgi:hypothetical protein